jgi:hypothetical protein
MINEEDPLKKIRKKKESIAKIHHILKLMFS